MNTFDGYIRRDGTNSKVLLDGGDAKALSSFIGTLSYDNNKITYTKADGSTSYDLVDLSNYIYNLRAATSDNLGGIRIGFSQSGKNYPVKLDSNNKAYVYVPWEANSHYTTNLYVGDGTAENKITTNGNTRIAVTDDNNVRNYITLIGTGATTVSSDDNGKITVNTTYDIGTSAILNAGTNTEGKLWSAKTLVDYISDILGVDSTAITSLNKLVDQLHDNDTATGILVELAKKLNIPSSSIGSNKQPIYWNGSSFTTIGYTIEKSIPSNAVFTDTKYSFYVGENNSTKEHKNVSNPYFKLFENNTPTSIQIKAGTGISVNSDTNGNITIKNEAPDLNHNTHYTTSMYVGENNDTKANKAVNSPYFKLFDDNTRRSTLRFVAGTGIGIVSDANGNITITNNSPDQNHNTDKTGIKLGTVSGTNKTDSTVIINNSSTGLTIAGGTNKFSIGDGTNYIEVPITPSFTVSNKDATIGTSLTTIATIAGTDIKAKIGSYLPLNGGTLIGELISQNGGIWVQGGSSAGGNIGRMKLVNGTPINLAFKLSKRGVRIYSNAIAFADPYNGNSNSDSGWVRHIEEKPNSGILEIAVGDDGNEEIRFRRYNTSSNIVSDVLVPNTTGTLALTSQIPTDNNQLTNGAGYLTSHYVTGLYIGATNDKSNAATNNGNTYLKLFDNDTKRTQFKISGTQNILVSSDASGNITITGPDLSGLAVTSSVAWDNVTGKPSTFTPSSHNHDGRYMRTFGTIGSSNSLFDVNADPGYEGTITYDPVATNMATVAESNPNVTALNLGNDFGRRKQLLFTYSNDNIYYRRHVRQNSTTSSWTSTVKLIHTGNVSPSLDINGNTIRSTVGEVSSSYITVPYATNAGSATNAGDSDKLDGYHAADFRNTIKDYTYYDVNISDTNNWFHIGSFSNCAYFNELDIYVTGLGTSMNNTIHITYCNCTGWSFTKYIYCGESTNTTSLTKVGFWQSQANPIKLFIYLANTYSNSYKYTGYRIHIYYNSTSFTPTTPTITNNSNVTQQYTLTYGNNIYANLIGTASSASALTTNAGSATQPVYFYNGVPTACSYQLNKTVPSNAVFTDTHVTQRLDTGNANRPLLFSRATTEVTTLDSIDMVYRNNSIYANPSTGTITANKFNGNASSASKLTTNAGSATQPVYFYNGVPTACSYQLNKTVPSDAVFTDIHSTQRLTSNNANSPLLFSAAGIANTATDVTNIVYRNNSIYANPSTGTITANKFNGSSTHADTSSQSGFVENHGDNLEHYWMKLWEIDAIRIGDDYDITFLLQAAFQEMQGTLHVRIRQNGNGGSSGWAFVTSMRLTSGNIDKTRVRLYYNKSTGNCQLWYNCRSKCGCINAKILHKTSRFSNEVPTSGTMYSTATAEQQTLPGTGYKYVEPTYAVYAEWNDIQNKPSSYPVQLKQDISTNANYPLVWTTSASDANEPQSALYKSFDKLLYNPSRSWLRSGTLELYPLEELPYATGIRIHSTPSGVASLVFCGTDNTGISGTSANSWFFGTDRGNIYLNKNGAAEASNYRIWGHSNGYTIGNTTESGYNFTVGGTSRFIGTTTTSHIVPASNYTYDIGSNTVEYANVFSRGVFARHLNASASYSNDKDLYLGYLSTTNIYFYITDANGNNRKRIALFKQDGNAAFDNTVTAASFYSSSDIRLKNIISNPIYKAEDFANLDLVKYTWKGKDDKIHLGSIAQSVEKEFPELVNTNQDGYKSLDYSVLGVVGIISLAKEIIELKEEIKKLKSKLYG